MICQKPQKQQLFPVARIKQSLEDTISFSCLASACEKGFRWRWALQTLETTQVRHSSHGGLVRESLPKWPFRLRIYMLKAQVEIWTNSIYHFKREIKIRFTSHITLSREWWIGCLGVTMLEPWLFLFHRLYARQIFNDRTVSPEFPLPRVNVPRRAGFKMDCKESEQCPKIGMISLALANPLTIGMYTAHMMKVLQILHGFDYVFQLLSTCAGHCWMLLSAPKRKEALGGRLSH